jgi:hypothetical protein
MSLQAGSPLAQAGRDQQQAADMGEEIKTGISCTRPKKLKENLMNRPVERRSGGWIETRDRPAV